MELVNLVPTHVVLVSVARQLTLVLRPAPPVPETSMHPNVGSEDIFGVVVAPVVSSTTGVFALKGENRHGIGTAISKIIFDKSI
jgi:hypothetical protein